MKGDSPLDAEWQEITWSKDNSAFVNELTVGDRIVIIVAIIREFEMLFHPDTRMAEDRFQRENGDILFPFNHASSSLDEV